MFLSELILNMFYLCVSLLLGASIKTVDLMEIGLDNNFHGPSLTCLPGFTYISSYLTCNCSEQGTWLNAECAATFGSKEMRPTRRTNDNCEPASYVFTGCNVCRCTEQGTIEAGQCTQKICKQQQKFIANENPATLNKIISEIKLGNKKTGPQKAIILALKQAALNKLTKDDSDGNKFKSSKDNKMLGIILKALYKNRDSFKSGWKKSRNVKESQKQVLPSKLDENKLTTLDKYEDGLTSEPSENVVNKLKEEEQYNENELTEILNAINPNLKHIVNTHDSDKNKPDNKNKLKASSQFEANVKIAEELIEKEKNRHKLSEILKDSDPKSKYFVINMAKDSKSDLIIIPANNRKTVSLSLDSGCVPGEVKKRECNTCFCLQNGKLLCTKKNCKS